MPGIAVGRVTKDDSSIWVSGTIARDSTTGIRPSTLFSIQSISKFYTALLVFLAEADGLLNLDAPLVEYLVDLHLNSRLEEEPERRITLRHLLSHTAGLTHEAPVGGNYSDCSVSFEDHLRSIRGTWLRFPVGQRYSYSNVGFDLAAEALQVVLDADIESIFRRLLGEPLNLTRTTYDAKTSLSDSGHASGHDPKVPHPSSQLPMVGAGGVFTAAQDVVKLLQVILSDGVYDGNRVLPSGLLSRMAEIPFPVAGQRFGYGHGIVVFQRRGEMIRGHSGGGIGFSADLYWAPDLGRGAFMLSNHASTAKQQLLVFELLLPEERTGKVAPDSVGNSAFSYESFFGEYVGRDLIVRIANQDDVESLVLVLPAIHGLREESQTVYSLISLSSTEAMAGPHHVRFMLDAYGRPSALMLVADGTWLDFNVATPDDDPADELAHFYGKYAIHVSGTAVEVCEIIPGQPPLIDYPSSTGEVLDARLDSPTYANIPLHRLFEASLPQP